MITVIYRIYEVKENTPENNYSWSEGIFDRILDQNMLQCEDREEFKSVIRSMYGDDIKFKKSRKLKSGDIYCVIISYSAYGASNYLDVEKCNCSYCKKEYIETNRTKIKLHKPEICYINTTDVLEKNNNILESVVDKWLNPRKEDPNSFLSNNITRLDSLHFCCIECKNKYLHEIIIPELEKESLELKNSLDYVPEEFISKDSFYDYHHKGYIYKITKKSTGQFYVGQTKYNPIFRWGQHLLTERFNLNNICDYKFEVIEIVKDTDNILERETYWINKCYSENPSLSLNIIIPKEHIKSSIDLTEDERNNI